MLELFGGVKVRLPAESYAFLTPYIPDPLIRHITYPHCLLLPGIRSTASFDDPGYMSRSLHQFHQLTDMNHITLGMLTTERHSPSHGILGLV